MPAGQINAWRCRWCAWSSTFLLPVPPEAPLFFDLRLVREVPPGFESEWWDRCRRGLIDSVGQARAVVVPPLPLVELCCDAMMTAAGPAVVAFFGWVAMQVLHRRHRAQVHIRQSVAWALLSISQSDRYEFERCVRCFLPGGADLQRLFGLLMLAAGKILDEVGIRRNPEDDVDRRRVFVRQSPSFIQAPRPRRARLVE